MSEASNRVKNRGAIAQGRSDVTIAGDMAYASFGDFIEALDKAGELQRITEPVATELEITVLADHEMKQPGGGKALLFEKPTVDGVVSSFPVAINTMGSWKRMAIALGSDSVEKVAAELGALDEGQAADVVPRGHQVAGNRAGPAPRPAESGQDRAVQGGDTRVRAGRVAVGSVAEGP